MINGLLGLMVDTGQKYREIDNTVSSTAPVYIFSLASPWQCCSAVQQRSAQQL